MLEVGGRFRVQDYVGSQSRACCQRFRLNSVPPERGRICLQSTGSMCSMCSLLYGLYYIWHKNSFCLSLSIPLHKYTHTYYIYIEMYTKMYIVYALVPPGVECLILFKHSGIHKKNTLSRTSIYCNIYTNLNTI